MMHFRYNVLGQPTSYAHANGMTTQYGYDEANRLTKIEHKDGQTVLQMFAYEYDDVGNITNITNSADANPNWSYAYDERYRLTQYAEHQSGLGTVWTRNYTYDPGDNLVTKTISDTSTQIVFQYNAANELTRRTENVAKEHA